MLHLETWVAQAKAALVAANLAGGKLLENEDKPSRDAALPVAHVSIGEDNAAPDGDARHMPVRLKHTTEIVVEVLDVANNGRELRPKLVAHAQIILDTLLTDLAWTVVAGGKAEGVGSVKTEIECPPEGGQVTGRVMIIISLLWRSSWTRPTTGLPSLARIDVDAGDGLGARVPLAT